MMRFGFILIVIAILSSAALAYVTPGPGGLIISDVIDQAYKQGEINFDTQMLYYAYAIMAPQKLPARFQPYVGTLKSGTPLVMRIMRNRDKIAPGIFAEIQQLFARPGSLAGSLHSGTYPFWVHYTSAGWASQASAGVNYCNTSWTTEVVNQGFDAPPPDHWTGYPGGGGPDADYDFYLDGNLPSGAMGVTYPEFIYTPTPRFDMTSYILVEPDMTVPQTEATFCHEFNHGLQMGIDMTQQALMECGATYSEEVVYDDANDCYGYVSSCQNQPHTQILSNSGLFPYGAFIFYVFLEDRYFHTPNWYSTAYLNSTNNSSTNEPDIFDSLATQLQAEGATMQEMWHEFSIWRIFTGTYADSYHFNETYPAAPSFVADYTPAQLPVQNFHPPSTWRPQKSGTSLVRFNTDTSDSPFTVCFSGDPATSWAASLVGKKTSGEPDVLHFTLSEGAGSITIPNWNIYQYVFLVVTNLGNGDYDTESDWNQSYDWHMNANKGDGVGVGVNNFAAEGTGKGIVLSWQNLESLPVSGFNLYRAAGNAVLPKSKSGMAAYQRINATAIVGHSPYHFVDGEVKPRHSYTYVLTAIGSDGKEVICGNTNGDTMHNPVALSMGQPSPNPTSSTASVRYALSVPGRMSLDIYDISGRLVRNLASGDVNAGENSVMWDGKDSSGHTAANGVYTVTLSAQGKVETRRLVVAH
jgi:hypothetical protein